MEPDNTREDWRIACDADEFEGEELLECRSGDQQILLVRTESGVVACPAVCPHMDERLAHGIVDGNVLTCTKHLWQWDLSSGEPIGMAEMPLQVAPVRLEGGKYVVNVERLKRCGDASCS